MLELIPAITLKDFYKADHRRQYPNKTQMVYSNLTPRMTRKEGTNGVVFFGLQYLCKEYLIDRFNRTFFHRDRELAVGEYKRIMDYCLGPDAVPVEHIGELHDLGYLPILIKALPEGFICPIKTPCMTIMNTDERFFWLVNYLETLISNIMWKPMTSATTAYAYKKRFVQHAKKTGYDPAFCNWQGHDFSYRGMSGLEDACLSGSGHLLSFTGTDTVPAIPFVEMFYNADITKELVGGSVPATEHSVMCMGGMDDELGTFNRLITELYPSGIVSIVSDTWDFWKVITEYLPALKDKIVSRDGRLVIRPDSGDPVKIICGDPDSDIEHIRKGAYECLWDTFGGTISPTGYKCLTNCIGLIYGDSITEERQAKILEILEEKGFSASNLVLGIGSFTYEYVTRDTHGFAMKATWGVVDGVEREIFKAPKTDSGFKTSARGLIHVYEDGSFEDRVTLDEEENSFLQPVFINGGIIEETSLAKIRARLNEAMNNGI